MQLERIYYTFPVVEGVELLVEVEDGDPVEYGSRRLPFIADGELAVGDSREFDATFVLHVPGRSEVEVGTPPREALVFNPELPEQKDVAPAPEEPSEEPET